MFKDSNYYRIMHKNAYNLIFNHLIIKISNFKLNMCEFMSSNILVNYVNFVILNNNIRLLM